MKSVLYRNIEAERVRRGLTKEALSQQLGITTQTYLSWIRGTTEIPASKLMTMSQAWKVSVDYLLQHAEEPDKAG